MNIALTGGTGFLGRFILKHLLHSGHSCVAWCRSESSKDGLADVASGLRWVQGDLSSPSSMSELVDGTDAVVHAALDRPSRAFRGAEGDMATFVQRNVLGTVQLIEAARTAGVPRFVFISTCALHEVILDDRPLDEAHPLWPTSHYGAYKAAVEKFIHSYGLGHGYEICSLRPTGIYGVAHPVSQSKWHDIVHSIARGESFSSSKGGKEVHAADVAKAVGILLTAEGIAGQAYNCYDRYVAEQDVAEIAKRLTGSRSVIERLNRGPKHQIQTAKLRALGMEFGGKNLLEQTVQSLLDQ